MAARPVEWVLVVYYGLSAHRATYGRLDGKDTKYTKDYIQLTRKKEFLEAVSRVFSVAGATAQPIKLKFQWPTGSAPGEFVFRSADRPHLKWETSLGAPAAWKMALSPTDGVAETIPGNPSHRDFANAEKERKLIAGRGAGQPYLLAIKLKDEPRTLHLRTYLGKPDSAFAWADLDLVPKEIREVAAKTSDKPAIAWTVLQSSGKIASPGVKAALASLAASTDQQELIDKLDPEIGKELAVYLKDPGKGLFFDPTRNHDAWVEAQPLSEKLLTSLSSLRKSLEARYPTTVDGDAAAEEMESDPDEVRVYGEQIQHKSFAVEDSVATSKTRGSAQKAFADAVKGNYGYRCAVTNIATKDFLVASHIVPWALDQSIRLDPSNGICLSILVDRAFERGYLVVEDDLTIRIDLGKLGGDKVLGQQLKQYDGQKLRVPKSGAPSPAYLGRRRKLVGK